MVETLLVELANRSAAAEVYDPWGEEEEEDSEVAQIVFGGGKNKRILR